MPSPRGKRKTRRSVLFAELVSRYLITTGGIGTIVAVVGVFLFLLYVVCPLFLAAEVSEERPGSVDWGQVSPLQMGMDEHQVLCWCLMPDGMLHVVHAGSGLALEKRLLFPDAKLTAVSFTPGEPAAFGFADGSVRMGTIQFSSRLLAIEQAPQEVKNLPVGSAFFDKDGAILRSAEDRYQKITLDVDLKAPAKSARSSPVLLIDQSKTPTGQVIAVLTADRKLRLNTIREQKNLLTDETTYKLIPTELPYVHPAGKGEPFRMVMSALGDQIYLLWRDGHLIRFDVRDRSRPKLAATRNLLEQRSQQLTDVRCLLGKSTYLVGDSTGRVKAWFFTPGENGDGQLVCGHDLPGPGAAVSAMAVSERGRSVAVAYGDGSVRLFQVTSERVVLDLNKADNSETGPAMLALAPKDDGLILVHGNRLRQWSFDPGYPEVSVKALFGPVWYEGYDKPQFIWQSTGATNAYEPKLSLVPLIFGTLKASFYSLLFAVPLALLAAIYTSEFLHARTKAVIKPAIELMASLPSVVLGFLAGLVFAQFIEKVVPAVLASLFTVPLAFVAGAYCWQLLPVRVAQVLSRWRLLFICTVLPAGLLAGMVAGPVLEGVLFAGNLRGWLDSGRGSATGGWVLVLLPLCAITCALAMSKIVTPWLRSQTAQFNRWSTALFDLSKFVSGCLATVALAWAVGMLLNVAGLDPRGPVADPRGVAWDDPDHPVLRSPWFMGPYSQRNALVVGLIVGFAIIPIIYTIAEDALSSVPEHLRAGSLATGATRWQTAMRIVIPTAMSGLFSAVMIGTGRAVGETMIMVMATGNTPVMDWSIFSGFSTLSARIAVELPDTVQNSTHYRLLFLAALVLFAMTFVLNTVAEVVRQRFRRRAYQL